jgi:hypothetical protein
MQVEVTTYLEKQHEEEEEEEEGTGLVDLCVHSEL